MILTGPETWSDVVLDLLVGLGLVIMAVATGFVLWCRWRRGDS